MVVHQKLAAIGGTLLFSPSMLMTTFPNKVFYITGRRYNHESNI